MSLLADYLRRVAERSVSTNEENVADYPASHVVDADEDVGDRRVTLRRLALSAAVALLGAAVVRRLRHDRG